MPKTALIPTRTNLVAIHKTFGTQNRAAPTDAVARLCYPEGSVPLCEQ
jgi:hypothetical protein